MEYIKQFYEQAKLNGNKTVVTAYGRKISYAELEKRSSEVAYYLEDLVAKGNRVIGIVSNGTVEHFILMFACLKSGIRFINLDVNAPEEYLRLICSQLEIQFCFYSENFDRNIPKIIKKIKLENLKNMVFKSIEQKNRIQSNSDIIYYIATSGTTGVPKIVCKTEKALLYSSEQIKKELPFFNGQIIQQYAPLNFAFGLDLTLILLISGNEISIERKKQYIDIVSMCKDIEKNNATGVFWSAAIIKLLSKQPELFSKFPKCLKFMVAGGEPLVVSASFVFEMHKHGIKLYNNYGCTEVGTIFFSEMNLSIFNVEEFNKIICSRALAGYEPVILNEKMEETQKGTLYIKGKSFDNYYLDKKLDIRKRIIILDRYPGYKLYDTGDICQKLDGGYAIIGRKDNCVNIKGYRVEIENVEYETMRVLKGSECCVIPIENIYNEVKLICYYKNSLYEPIEVRHMLEVVLPEYMIPLVFIQTDEIYYSKNGKVNRKKMKEKYQQSINSFKENTESETLEEKIVSMLEKMLKIKISEGMKKYPFKDLGLDSLGTVDFISTVEKNIDVAIEDTLIEKGIINNIETLIECIEKKRGKIDE